MEHLILGVALLPTKIRNLSPAPTGIHLGYKLIALEVDDMQEAIEFLKTKGVDVVWGPVEYASIPRARRSLIRMAITSSCASGSNRRLCA